MKIDYVIEVIEVIETDLEELKDLPGVLKPLGKLKFLLRELKVERDISNLIELEGGKN